VIYRACERWGLDPDDFLLWPADKQRRRLGYETLRQQEEAEALHVGGAAAALAGVKGVL